MNKAIRNIFLIALAAIFLLSFAGCKEEKSDATGNSLKVETLRVLPKAYQFEEYDLRDIIIMEDDVDYSATACYVEQKLDVATATYTMSETTVEVADLCFTPETLNDTVVTITATRGKETASKKVSISTIVRADPLDDLYKASGVLGFGDTGITKSINTNKLYIQGENSATSLKVKFNGKDAHDWGNIFMELSHPSAQALFTDKIWDNAIVTFWVYNPMDQDIEFQLTVDDHTFPVMLDWTGEEGNFRRQFAKAGEWTQIFFSLRRMGTTHKLVTDMYSTESLTIKFQYAGYSTTQEYEMEFYLDNLDVVPASTYPEIDCTYTASNETLEQGWENMAQDAGWQGASTIYVYDEMMGAGSACSLYATFDSAKGLANPFVVLNPEMMLGNQYMKGLPDMTGGTLTAYFKFSGAAEEVYVDLVKEVGKDWQFSNALPMTLTAAGNGWYKGTLDVSDFAFTTERNDNILRIRFTFSGVSKSSKVWIDTVKFDYKNVVKVKETLDKDWINLPIDSGMTSAAETKFSTDYKKAEGSVRSLQITARKNESGVLTLAPEFAVLEGNMSKVPDLTKGVIKAYFYFGDQNPEASMRLYNSSWKYCRDVNFIFEAVGDGWYLGSIPVSLFQGYTEGNSSKIIRISMMIPAGYTVYVDGLMHYPNEEYKTELNADDVFASGIFSTVGFGENSNVEIVKDITNGSADAIYMWAKKSIGWPEAGVRFAVPVDISGYASLSLDAKFADAHPWVGVKIYYLDSKGVEQSAEVGVDFAGDAWRTVQIKLNKFKGADLTKVTGIMFCVNFGDTFQTGKNNQIWMDNLKLIAKTEEEIKNPGISFSANEGEIIEFEAGAYGTVAFDYKLTSEGVMGVILRCPTWLEYYGEYQFDANGLAVAATGVTTEKLSNGYIRVTMRVDQLNRTGCADNLNSAPETISMLDIYGAFTTASGVIDNVKVSGSYIRPVEPSEPSEPETGDQGENFTAGVTKNILLTDEAIKNISFEYKLTAGEKIHVILRAPDWIKYYGDYEFGAEGEPIDYAGVSTEKLDNGYIRVTMVFSQLERSGCDNNRDNAPATVGVLDIYEWGNASGYVNNIQLDVDITVPDVPAVPDEPDSPDEPEIPDESDKPFNANDIFASGEIVADGFVGDCGYEVTTEVTNNSTDAVHVWTNTKIGWPTVGVSFASPVDISDYENIALDVKVNNTYKWISIQIGYLNGNGAEVIKEVGADLSQEDWQTVTMKLSQFAGADLTKVTKILICMNLETNVSTGICNEVWLDNLKVLEAEIDENHRGQLFEGGKTFFVEMKSADYESISFEYKLVTEGAMTLILRDSTWLKYFGDYIFTADGEFSDYAGVTTEKLGDGYVRVTMVMDALIRSGLADNRDNAPQTLAIFDVYTTTTANGYVDNIQGVEREVQTEKTFDPENIFASGEIVADGFVGDCGCEVTTQVTNNSADALYIWTNTKIGWPTVGVSFASPVDISDYENIALDVKVSNTYKWISIKIGYLNGNGAEVFKEVGADFSQEDWQTVTMKLSQFAGADLTKVTKILICMNLENNVSAGVCNEVWLDNLKVTKTLVDLEPGGLELGFQAYANAFLTFEEHAFKAVQFDYKLESAGEMYIILRDGTWLKYFGDYAFNADGEVVDYTGVTTEKLSNGYIRVTMILDDLERTGCNNNRDIAPETLAVFDVFGNTTVNGHIKNLQFLNQVPTKLILKRFPRFLCCKPEWQELLQEIVEAE